MGDAPSKLFHILSWLAAILTGLASAAWIAIVAQGNYCWSAFAFTMGMAAPLGGGILVFVVLPSAAHYVRTKRSQDRDSFLRATGSFLTLVVEAVLVSCVTPQQGE
jgi:hypothetical protein